jgi:hypothetical protein
MSEFKAFGKILHINKMQMSITQKIHGSNAQILIENGNIHAGSRSRWLTPDDDNYGFCKWVIENRDELIEKLGEGRHFGEWAGIGINSGEGLKEKTLCLFNWRRWYGKDLPNRTTVVPLLYNGVLSIDAITETMEKLKKEGSFLVPGYMQPEGIVIELDGQLYKNVFDNEEVKWKQTTKLKQEKNDIDISYLLQPLRLEKLLSKDERYIREYPSSLGSICSDYVNDLVCENQFKCENEDELKAHKKALGKQVFYFVKSIVNAQKCA